MRRALESIQYKSCHSPDTRSGQFQTVGMVLRAPVLALLHSCSRTHTHTHRKNKFSYEVTRSTRPVTSLTKLARPETGVLRFFEDFRRMRTTIRSTQTLVLGLLQRKIARSPRYRAWVPMGVWACIATWRTKSSRTLSGACVAFSGCLNCDASCCTILQGRTWQHLRFKPGAGSQEAGFPQLQIPPFL